MARPYPPLPPTGPQVVASTTCEPTNLGHAATISIHVYGHQQGTATSNRRSHVADETEATAIPSRAERIPIGRHHIVVTGSATTTVAQIGHAKVVHPAAVVTQVEVVVDVVSVIVSVLHGERYFDET